MTAIIVVSVLALLVVGVLAFDWMRAGRTKKALASGAQTPDPRTRAQARDGVAYETMSRQANSTKSTGIGGI